MNRQSARTHILFWLGTLLFLGLFVYTFSAVLTPFVVGITIAYLLNPIVVKLERRNFSRLISTIMILSIFLLTAILLVALLIPPLYSEAVLLAESAPEIVEQLIARLEPYLSMARGGSDEGILGENILEVLRNNATSALGFSSSLLGGLLNGGRALVGFVSFLFITPLVSFLLMNEWVAITEWIDELIPRHSYDEVKDLLDAIDKKIAGFVRGQLMVAAALGIIYAVALSIAGLEFGFLIGLVAGLLSIIPLFGSIVGLVVSVAVAWFQSSSLAFVGIIAAIFLVGQVVEGNIITPKLLGSSVGIHSLWILFSIMAGAALFGITGMMLAVPVAATIGVLVGFAIDKYKSSEYFKS